MVVSIYNPNLFSTSAKGENPLFLASSISASNLARPAFLSARSVGVRVILVFGVAFFRSATVFVGMRDYVCIWGDIVLGEEHVHAGTAATAIVFVTKSDTFAPHGYGMWKVTCGVYHLPSTFAT